MLGPIVAVLGFIAYSLHTGTLDGAALFVFGVFGAIVLGTYAFSQDCK